MFDYSSIDIIWILLSAAFVFLMQAGFVCLESGLVRSKNSINVAAKNLIDICISGCLFWLFGYAVMFGDSQNGWFGASGFFLDEKMTPWLTSFFLFQLMFCGTATTLVSGAVAERMSFYGYLIVSFTVAGLIYPVIGHWAWAGLKTGESFGWLGKTGFIDFAGSTVVHSTGGWVALSAILIIGPRLGRFDNGIKEITGSNLTLSVLGVILLWLGWFGFNGGSTLALNDQVPGIILNTCLAAILGGLSASIASLVQYKTIHVTSIMNGILAGLVAITASCHLASPPAAAGIGAFAGILVVISSAALKSLKIDDAIDVIPVHLIAGIWGTLAVALFADPGLAKNGLGFWEQLKVQITGIIAIGVYSFGLSYWFLKIINRFFPLRVNAAAEQIGLNISEHRASTEILDLLTSMEQQRQLGDFSQPVDVEPFTEIGKVATQYNYVLERVTDEINQRQSALNAYQASESRKGAILNASLDCIITIDNEGLIQEFNPAAEKCFGMIKRQVIGNNFIDLFILQGDRGDVKESLNKGFLLKNKWIINHRNKTTLQRANGELFPAEVGITGVNFPKHEDEYTLTIRDVSRHVKLQNRIKKLAYYDGLTGLYGRSYFKAQLGRALEYAQEHDQQIVLMFLDLDKFKTINDSLGHKAGDDTLCIVAERLKSIIRKGDLIGRWAGDEFVIMFSNLNYQEDMENKANSILALFNQSINLYSKQLQIHVSIGIALTARQSPVSKQSEQLIHQADLAMYQAKEAGGNTYCFYKKEMQERIRKKFYFETEIQSALEKNQLFLEYQPQIKYQTGAVVCFEALIRWRHPEQGLISPGQFIPIMEESTMIIDLGLWVINEVCKQINSWKQQGLLSVRVAINLSGKHFMLTEFYTQIMDILERHSLNGNSLELEITETVLAVNTDQCIATMHKLKQANLSFAVDDFGTGYSSLSYLTKFPIDTLKIDQAFVSYCDKNKENAAVCSAIISLAKSLDLTIVAEGVEKQAQLDFLNERGCDFYQGYLFNPPLSATDAGMLLEKNLN